MTTPRCTRLGWALHLAERGWRVFTLRPGTKKPTGHRETGCRRAGRCREGHQTLEMYATTDPELIHGAWRHAPFNIGIATGPSGLVVVDLDVPKPGDTRADGLTSLTARAAERDAPLPETYTVATPSGGRHLYYRTPPGVRLRSTTDRLGPNVDTRAWGGYVVGPGSTLPRGGYELIDDRDPVELPAWLIQASLDHPAPGDPRPIEIRSTSTSAYAAAALKGEADRVRAAPPGQHNRVLSTSAYTIGRKIGAGLIDHATARTELLTAAIALVAGECDCTPTECERVIDAGLTAGARNPVTTSVLRTVRQDNL